MIDFKSIKGKGEREGWGQHPYTGHLARHVRDVMLKRALLELRGACNMSDDPKVTKALAEYQAVEAMAEFLEQSGREE
jgi:hypothetical protein